MKYIHKKLFVGFSITFVLVVIQNIILKKDEVFVDLINNDSNIILDKTNNLNKKHLKKMSKHLKNPFPIGENNNAKDEFVNLFKSDKLTEEDIIKMTGKSYDPKNSIDSSELRKLTVTHVGFDDNLHYGEIIVNATIADEVIDIFKELLEAKYPIEKIKLIDEYNGDDILSMSDNNSSAYNHRFIANTNKLSNHAQGFAIDINPIQNPYVNNDFISPIEGKDYLDRDKIKKGMVIKNDVCYNAFVSRGWTWGGAWQTPKDYQHFEKN